MSILWTIIIGFVAGVIAKFIMPGDNEPSGFILTTILGIVGAFVATFLGQAMGWYSAGQGAGLIGAVVGAIIVLVVYGHGGRTSAGRFSSSGGALRGWYLSERRRWNSCPRQNRSPPQNLPSRSSS